jgi:hypothetical protein
MQALVMLTHHIVPHAAFFLQDYTDITWSIEKAMQYCLALVGLAPV